MFWLFGWKPPTKYQCHGEVDYKLHPLSIRKKETKNRVGIFSRMGAHEQGLIIAPQVFSPISISVLWTAKLLKHPISTSWLTKEDFTRSFGAQTLWGTTIRCRGGAKRVENPGAVEQFWTLTDKSRVIFKCNQMFVETNVGLALSSEFTNTSCNFVTHREVVFSFAKTTWWNRLFLHLSTRFTCLTMFSLRLVRCFTCFSGKPCFYPCFLRFRNLKWHPPRFFARTGAHYHASPLQHSGRNQMVRNFSGHDPEHKEQMSHNRWFPTGLLF